MCAAEQSFKSEHPVNSPNLRNDRRIVESDIKSLDGMLTIGQVSMLTGIKKTTLRYWERKYNKFLIPNRIESSRRQYSMKDVEIIKTIKKLQDEEYLTVKGIYLRLNDLFIK
jgi:MerR HTH family regulatory protein